MRFFAILIIFLIPHSGSALDFPAALRVLEHKTFDLNEYQCEEKTEADLRECAEALCGPPEFAVKGYLTDNNLENYVDPKVKEQLADVDEAATELYHRKKKKIEHFIQTFRDQLQAQENFPDFTKFDDEQFIKYGDKIYGTYLGLEIDTSKQKDKRLKIIQTPPKNASKAFLRELRVFSEAKERRLKTDASYGLKSGLYTKDEGLTLLSGLSEKFFAVYDQEKKKNPELLKKDAQRLDRYRKVKDSFGQSDSDLGGEYAKLTALFSTLESETGKIKSSPVPDACTAECKTGIQKSLNKNELVKKLNTFENKMKTVDLKSFLTACQTQFIGKNLRQSDKEKFLARYPKIKSAFLEKALVGYSAHSKSAFEKYLDQKLKLDFSNDSSRLSTEMLTDLGTKAVSASSLFKSKKDVDLMTELLTFQDPVNPEEFNPGLQYCGDENPLLTTDAFSTKGAQEDTLKVSLFSCTHEEEGDGIIAHELGHALSSAFLNKKLSVESEKVYLKARACVTESYVNPSSGVKGYLFRQGDSVKTEEDMADLISFTVSQNEARLYTCTSLKVNKAGTQFTELSFETKHPEDPHSAPLLRVLREAIHKKMKLPAACEREIKKNQDTYRFRPCP